MKAILIGGGIGGSAAAILLKQAGIEVEVYEAREESKAYEGYFLNLAGNGIAIMKMLGLDDLEASPVPRMIIWNGQGKRLGEVRNGARDGLNISVIMRRGVLQKTLHQRLIDLSIPLHFGKSLAKLEGNRAILKMAAARKAICSLAVMAFTRVLAN